MDNTTKSKIIEEISKWKDSKNPRGRDGYIFLRDQLTSVGHWKHHKRGDGGSLERLNKNKWEEVNVYKKTNQEDQTSSWDY